MVDPEISFTNVPLLNSFFLNAYQLISMDVPFENFKRLYEISKIFHEHPVNGTPIPTMYIHAIFNALAPIGF